MCAGITIYQALKRCNPTAGQPLGIMGCGGALGHLGLQFATKMGLRVVRVDAADQGLRLAESMGTSAVVVEPRSQNALETVQQLAKHHQLSGLDAAIILPERRRAFGYGISLVKNHCRCVVVSFPKRGFTFSAVDVVFRDISIVSSLVGSNKTSNEMLEFAADHDIKPALKMYGFQDLN